MLPWECLSPNPKWHLDQFSCFCTAHGRVAILHTGRPISPLKFSLPTGDLDLHLIHGSLGPTVSSTQMASWSAQLFLQSSLLRQTDRHTMLLNLQCGLITLQLEKPSTEITLITLATFYQHLSSFDLELWPMTLTTELDLDNVRCNRMPNRSRVTSFESYIQRDRMTDTHNWLTALPRPQSGQQQLIGTEHSKDRKYYTCIISFSQFPQITCFIPNTQNSVDFGHSALCQANSTKPINIILRRPILFTISLLQHVLWNWLLSTAKCTLL